MDNLKKLKLLILESQYPMFNDEELTEYLEDNGNDVYKTASEICLLKANGEKKITVGPITIENADSSFWLDLSSKWSLKSSESKNQNSGGSKYTIKLRKSYL